MWCEVICGPRPPSVQWPKGKGQGKPDDTGGQRRTGASGSVFGGRWNGGDRSTESAKIRSLVGALAALWPKDTSAKTDIEATLKRAKAQESVPARVDPDAKMGAAHDRMARSEQAIAAMEHRAGCVGCGVEEAQELQLEVQMRAREGFIERVKKRIEHFDLERAAEVQRLEES